MIAAFGIVAFATIKRERLSMVVSGLVCAQAILIALLLTRQFRFFGGLQYVVLILAVSVIWKSRLAARAIDGWWVVLVGLCLPWVGVQVYYARPFVKVDLGLVSRDSFRDDFVAFSRDFRALDRLLPANAVLYVVNTRLPSYDAPRPVIFTLDDLRGRTPLYRFSIVEQDSPPSDDPLSCADTVYQNPAAISEVYRTPGRAAKHESLRVEKCDVIGRVRPDP